MSSAEQEHDEVEDEGAEGEDGEQVVFVDAATRVSNPSAFDTWYYGIEDKLGQGTVGMGLCLLLFILVLVVAIFVNPI